MPVLGGAPRSNVFRQECAFLGVPDDAPNPMDDNPRVDTDSKKDLRRESDPPSGTNNQPNWVPLRDHSPIDHGKDVQRTLQGLALGGIRRSTYGSGELSGGGYVNSETNNVNDSGLSPNTGNSGSDRPTPNSTTPSESRANLQNGQTSGATSYETSPASSHNPRGPVVAPTQSISEFYPDHPDYNISSTGLTPDNNGYTMPETPGFPVPPGWESTTTGLTSVGQGVFNQLMDLGPIDPMDLAWAGGS